LESLGATAIAPMRAPKNALARVQYGFGATAFAAASARHMNAPPIHIRAAVAGSWVNGVMNRKLPAPSVMPEVTVWYDTPPLVER